ARKPGAVAVDEPAAAVRAGLRVHGHARGAEGVEVAVDGPHRHLELGRELCGGHPAAGLEEQEEADQPAGAHCHDATEPSLTQDVTDAVIRSSSWPPGPSS